MDDKVNSILFIFTILRVTFGFNIINLSEKDFNKSISKYQKIFVLFYDPFGDVSKQFMQQYNNVAHALAKNHTPVLLAQFDCSTEYGKEISYQYEVLSTPILTIFTVEYNSFNELTEELSNNKEVIVLGIFENKTQSVSDTQSQFFKTSDKLGDSVIFRHVFTNSIPNLFDFYLLRNLKYTSLPNVVLIRPSHLRNKFDINYVVYSFGEIRDFIKFNYHGLVGVRTHNNKDFLKLPFVISYYNLNYENNTQKTNYWRNRILKVAKDHRDIKFAISDANSFANELENYGFKSVPEDIDVKPIVVIIDKNEKIFIMKNNFSVDNLSNFVIDFKTGKLSPFIISEELPKDNENSNVKVVVAHNIEELVLNNSKDTLIEFYAPGCHHCKQLDPVYDELGNLLKNEPNVQIARMNYIANHVPKIFKVFGFPTIYFYCKNKKIRIYLGDRSLEDFIKFIAKYSTKELEGFDRNGRKHTDEL